MDYHIAPIADVAQSLQTSPDGLDPATAQRRLDEVGPNQLVDAKRKTVGQLLLHQFTDVMILVLLAAAAISFLVGETKLGIRHSGHCGAKCHHWVCAGVPGHQSG